MENLYEKYRIHIDDSITKANKLESKITDDILNIDGMTGKKTRHFYNNILNMDDARYFEIGTWKGSSVCSAMFGNKAEIICVDNWSEFNGPKEEFLNNFEKFKGENSANFLEQDCFTIDPKSLPKFNIYLYDGCHSREDQMKALSHFIECLDEIFIFIVDDWFAVGCEDVRSGTFDGILKCDLDILYQVEIPQSKLGKSCAEDWWNGLYLAILKKK